MITIHSAQILIVHQVCRRIIGTQRESVARGQAPAGSPVQGSRRTDQGGIIPRINQIGSIGGLICHREVKIESESIGREIDICQHHILCVESGCRGIVPAGAPGAGMEICGQRTAQAHLHIAGCGIGGDGSKDYLDIVCGLIEPDLEIEVVSGAAGAILLVAQPLHHANAVGCGADGFQTQAGSGLSLEIPRHGGDAVVKYIRSDHHSRTDRCVSGSGGVVYGRREAGLTQGDPTVVVDGQTVEDRSVEGEIETNIQAGACGG